MRPTTTFTGCGSDGGVIWPGVGFDWGPRVGGCDVGGCDVGAASAHALNARSAIAVTIARLITRPVSPGRQRGPVLVQSSSSAGSETDIERRESASGRKGTEDAQSSAIHVGGGTAGVRHARAGGGRTVARFRRT